MRLLARGPYAILYGLHPLTGEPYRQVGSKQLLDTKPFHLPVITSRQVDAFRLELAGDAANTENFFDIVRALQKKTRVKLCVTAKAA